MYTMEYVEIVKTAFDTVIASHIRGDSAMYYVRGYDPRGSVEPHYPVPSTLGIVTISHDTMAIWPSDDHWDYPMIEWCRGNYPVPAIIYTVEYQHDEMWGHAVVLWRETDPGHFDGFECVEVWDIHH